jgi:hypothetical protein
MVDRYAGSIRVTFADMRSSASKRILSITLGSHMNRYPQLANGKQRANVVL